MKTSNLIVKALESEQVEFIFGIPKKENLNFIESISTSKIQFILTRNEQSAAFMAVAYSQLTGKTGVCLTTSLSVTNLIPAIIYAQQNSLAMLVITANENSCDKIYSSLYLDQMIKSISKAQIKLIYSNTISNEVHNSFRVAEQNKAGVVHLQLPNNKDELLVNNTLNSNLRELDLNLNNQTNYGEFHNEYHKQQSQLIEFENNNSFPLLPQRIAIDVYKSLPEAGYIALDNGNYLRYFLETYDSHQKHTLLFDESSINLATALPSAISCALVHHKKPIIVVCGDGSFMMNSQEIETAIRLEINLVILIIRDDSFGITRRKQSQMGHSDFGLEFGNPDFVKYAESFGAVGHRILITENLLPCIKDCIQNKGVHLIEIPVNYSEC